MKVIRLVVRIAFISLACAAFVALTQTYAHSVRVPLPDPGWRGERAHRPSAPELGKFPELVGESLVIATYAVAGRIVLRLRLSPVSRGEGEPILLGLDKAARAAKSSQIWK
ncbi:MAG: hypothetical protein JO108_21840 [Acidobacteriaceae bacterium]|nr:hypothetical protein [Acidobacteriaceae bacterium]